MDGLRKHFGRDRFAESLGIEILEVGPGSARLRMPVTARHLNSILTVHGGALFSLADMAFAVASNSHGILSVALNAHISYLKASREGAVLYAEASEVSTHPKISVYTVRICEEAGELIALFQGTAYRKDKLIADLASSETPEAPGPNT